ncbi:hypothetical protein Cgig2_033762 [Carnegiea gigantea]|uniref:Uncharacterized protein n=1 Tax=Carnegiea gigantea TaxID=171969 RepID=A0A9Q1KJP3_9CARY|nr:hypothetical protein Cgig2_033762 [Carnegiea gigantea]
MSASSRSIVSVPTMTFGAIEGRPIVTLQNDPFVVELKVVSALVRRILIDSRKLVRHHNIRVPLEAHVPQQGHHSPRSPHPGVRLWATQRASRHQETLGGSRGPLGSPGHLRLVATSVAAPALRHHRWSPTSLYCQGDGPHDSDGEDDLMMYSKGLDLSSFGDSRGGHTSGYCDKFDFGNE